MLQCKFIDLATYKHLSYFRLFSRMENPFINLTVKVDVTPVLEFCKKKGCSFYTAFIHLVAVSANKIPEFRQRIYNDGIIEYDNCLTSNIEILEDKSYCYCYLRHDMDWDEYLEYARIEREKSRENPTSIENSDILNFIYIFGVKFHSFEHLTLPYMNNKDSNPRISWGLYEQDFDGKTRLPLSLQVHHGLIDIYQIKIFLENLEKMISEL